MADPNIEEIMRRKRLVDHYYRNFRKFYEAKKYSKASEFLWGTINNLAYAIGLFYDRKVGGHNETVDFIEELALVKKNDSIGEQLASAQRIHANFFHDFMTESMFEDDRIKTEKLIEFLSEILDDEIQDLISG